jgi:competence protein ComFC
MPLDPERTLPLCEECRKNPLPYSELRALSFYKGAITELVHSLKFKKRWSAADVIAGLLLKHIDPDYFKVDALVPVPLHKKRLKKRGYNQSSLILRKISRYFGIPVLEHALKREKDTAPQSLLPKSERIENMKKAFVLGHEFQKISNRRVLLFDDVTTTGHTVTEACRVLQNANPASIRVLTAAKSL